MGVCIVTDRTRYLSPIVILADDESDVRPISAALRRLESQYKRESGPDLIAGVQTIHDFVPDDQQEKIWILKKLKSKLGPRIQSEMSDKDRELVHKYLTRAVLSPVTVEGLPALIRKRFSEQDGEDSSWFSLMALNKVGNRRMIINGVARAEYFPMLADNDFHFTIQYVDELFAFMNRARHLFCSGSQGHQERFHAAVSHAGRQ